MADGDLQHGDLLDAGEPGVQIPRAGEQDLLLQSAPATAASSDLGLEIAWTLGPTLILLMITIPTVRTIFRSQPAVAPAAALKIKVVAYQWWWEFEYPDGVKTSNELHIPVNWPVRLELQSGDIIHSFWVPQLGGKRDVVPGQINQITFIANTPGEYPGQCAEFCGLSHANMRFRVFVDSAENCATAVQETLDRHSLPSPATERGELHVALTDAADNFLNVARDALQLDFGEIELQPLP